MGAERRKGEHTQKIKEKSGIGENNQWEWGWGWNDD